MDCETVLFAFIEFDGSVFTMMLRLFELKLQLLVSVINEDEELLTVIEYIIQDIIGWSLAATITDISEIHFLTIINYY